MLVPLLITLLVGLPAWYPVLWLLGQVDGWADLARQYRRPGTPVPAGTVLTSATVGGLQLGGMRLAVQPEGLSVVPFVLFRPGHPPLRIPWHAVRTVYRQRVLGVDRTRLMVSVEHHPDDVPIILDSAVLTPAYPWLPPVEPGSAGSSISWRVLLVAGIGWLLALLVIGVIWLRPLF